MARAGVRRGVRAPRRSGSRAVVPIARVEMSPADRHRARLSLPFAAIAGLGVALVPLPGGTLERGDWMVGGLLVLAVWLSIVRLPWERIPPRAQLVPLICSLVA